MKLKFKHQKKASVIAVFLVLSVSGAAYAYWSAGGAGTGTATTDTATADLTVNQTTVLDPMYPGLAAQTISGTFNNTNDGPVYVGTLTASIDSVVKDPLAVEGTCDATDYTLANAVMTVDAEIPVGSAQGAWTGATIEFNNKVTNQDACQGATINLAYAIS